MLNSLFSIEYQRDRTMWMQMPSAESPQSWKQISILDGVTMGTTKGADAQDPVVAKADEEIHKPVQETAILDRSSQAYVNLHVTDWVTTQQEDPILKTVIKWLCNQKVKDLKPLHGECAECLLQ